MKNSSSTGALTNSTNDGQGITYYGLSSPFCSWISERSISEPTKNFGSAACSMQSKPIDPFIFVDLAMQDDSASVDRSSRDSKVFM